MRKLLLSVAALVAFSGLMAQKTEKRPSYVGISFLMNDYETASRIRNTSLNSVIANGTWNKFKNMSPGASFVYGKELTDYIDFTSQLSGSFVTYTAENITANSEKFLAELDATANFHLLPYNYIVRPYALLGVGAAKYGKSFGAFIPTGIGFKIGLGDDVNIFTNAQYRIPVTTGTMQYHFMYQLGFTENITSRKKPELIPVPPAPEPPPPPVVVEEKPVDSDGDGIPDKDDKCPNVPGLVKYNGCPVPDTDGDGINDEEDKCPAVAGVARYGGCPVPDTDGDGINDEEDKCPTQAGPASNKGCPEVAKEVVEKVNFAAKNIYFTTGKFALLSKSFKGLDEVAAVLAEQPQLMISVEGHTDNTGNAALNQKLSENRANAVKEYLVKKGIPENRIQAAGFGSDNPKADNKTAAGRQENRRVELKLAY